MKPITQCFKVLIDVTMANQGGDSESGERALVYPRQTTGKSATQIPGIDHSTPPSIQSSITYIEISPLNSLY